MKRIGVFLSAVLFLSCACTNSTGQKEGNDQPNILFILLDDLGYSDLGCYGGEVLHSAGYQTFYVGKWHMHHRTSPTKRGFDEFYGYDMGYAQDQWDQPWFLFLGHSSPHFPVQAPTETIDKYYEMYLQGWDLLREQRFDRMKETGQFENTLIMLTSDNGACYEWGPFGFDNGSRRKITKLHTGDELLEMGQSGTSHAYGSAWANFCNTPLRLYKHFTHEGGPLRGT